MYHLRFALPAIGQHHFLHLRCRRDSAATGRFEMAEIECLVRSEGQFPSRNVSVFGEDLPSEDVPAGRQLRRDLFGSTRVLQSDGGFPIRNLIG